jgi:hypothetical protein
MQDGALYPQQTLVQTIKEKESGLWLTPSTVNIPVRSQESMEKRLDYRAKIGRNGVGAGCLSEQVEWSQDGPPIGYLTREMIPTPTSSTGGANHNSPTTVAGKRFGMNLAGYAQKWPTPMATDWKPRGPNSKQQGLGEKVKWPTPTANMHKGSGPTLIRSDGKDRSWDSLHYAVEQVTDIGGTLNPTWVEWLMGWPLGWTDLNQLGMDKYQKWQEQHGVCLNKKL